MGMLGKDFFFGDADLRWVYRLIGFNYVAKAATRLWVFFSALRRTT